MAYIWSKTRSFYREDYFALSGMRRHLNQFEEEEQANFFHKLRDGKLEKNWKK